MSQRETNEYILGTDNMELFRLGLQHQVWASEAQTGWKNADFTAGQTLLDLGSGPGFCSKELAFITGPTGKVIAIDRSAHYIDYVQDIASKHNLNIEGIVADFDDMQLAASSLDGMYCRWAMAWIKNPKEILAKVQTALKPGAKMVLHEYYDWSTHQLEPTKPNLKKSIAACFKSFKEQEGDIDVGRHLPSILKSLGMKIVSLRPMVKLARPGDFTWHWPKSFYHTYFPRLVEMAYLTEAEKTAALQEMDELEQIPETTLFCPSLIEVVAEKV